MSNRISIVTVCLGERILHVRWKFDRKAGRRSTTEVDVGPLIPIDQPKVADGRNQKRRAIPKFNQTMQTFYGRDAFIKAEPFDSVAQEPHHHMYCKFRQNKFFHMQHYIVDGNPCKRGEVTIRSHHDALESQKPWTQSGYKGLKGFFAGIIDKLTQGEQGGWLKPRSELPVIVHVCHSAKRGNIKKVNKDGTMACRIPCLLSLHPFPLEGIIGAEHATTDPILKLMTDQMVDFVVHWRRADRQWPP
jgi:hypothetical protein